MQITINGKVYDIYFGLEALAYLDDEYELNFDLEELGVSVNSNTFVGQGINMLIYSLQNNSLVAVGRFIKAGTTTLLAKPSNKDIDFFVADLTEKDTLEEFCKEAIDFLSNAPLTKKRMKDIEETQKEEEKKEATKEKK